MLNYIAGVTKSSIVVLIIISALFVFLSLCMTPDTHPLEEDAFITFRYVQNFSNGNGMVFNQAERVEGISNISWALLLAFLSKLGFTLLVTSAIAGLGFGILTIWSVWFFSVYYFRRSTYFQFISAILLATHTSFICSCTSGLETAFYTFLITTGTICSILESRKGNAFPYSAMIFAFASMTRPEAPFLFTAILFAVVYKDFINHKVSKTTITSLLTFSLTYSFFIAFRIYYYGDILPNTVYARASLHPLSERVLTLFSDYIVNSKSYLIFFPALFLFFRIKPKETLCQCIVVIFVSIILLFFSTNGLHFVRYLCPILPLCFILVQEGLFDISIIIQRFYNVRYYKHLFITILISIIILINFLCHTIKQVFPVEIQYNPIRICLKSTLSDPSTIKKKFLIWYNIDYDLPQNFQALFGDWIRNNLPENSIIVYDQMGQTPFYAGLEYTFIDSLGLTDKMITQRKYRELIKIRNLASKLLLKPEGGRKKNTLSFSDYILSRNPDFIFVLVGSEDMDRLTSTVKFNREYQEYFPDAPHKKIRAWYRKISVLN